jgi:hypothetical protein
VTDYKETLAEIGEISKFNISRPVRLTASRLKGEEISVRRQQRAT